MKRLQDLKELENIYFKTKTKLTELTEITNFNKEQDNFEFEFSGTEKSFDKQSEQKPTQFIDLLHQKTINKYGNPDFIYDNQRILLKKIVIGIVCICIICHLEIMRVNIDNLFGFIINFFIILVHFVFVVNQLKSGLIGESKLYIGLVFCFCCLFGIELVQFYSQYDTKETIIRLTLLAFGIILVLLLFKQINIKNKMIELQNTKELHNLGKINSVDWFQEDQ